MRIANFNIRATPPMSSGAVRHDLRLARDLNPDVVCWQELGRWTRYRRMLGQEFTTRNGWLHFHARRRNLVSVNTDVLRVLRSRSVRLTRGNAVLPQPARFTNEVVVVPRLLDRHKVAVLCSHFDNGAYNGRWRPEWNRKLRRRRWDKQFEVTREMVHRLHEEGITVLGAGDYNRRNLERFHPEQVWLSERGIMKMWMVPAPGVRGSTTQRLVVEDYALRTDHPGLCATVALRGRAGP